MFRGCLLPKHQLRSHVYYNKVDCQNICVNERSVCNCKGSLNVGSGVIFNRCLGNQQMLHFRHVRVTFSIFQTSLLWIIQYHPPARIPTQWTLQSNRIWDSHGQTKNQLWSLTQAWFLSPSLKKRYSRAADLICSVDHHELFLIGVLLTFRMIGFG